MIKIATSIFTIIVLISSAFFAFDYNSMKNNKERLSKQSSNLKFIKNNISLNPGSVNSLCSKKSIFNYAKKTGTMVNCNKGSYDIQIIDIDTYKSIESEFVVINYVNEKELLTVNRKSLDKDYINSYLKEIYKNKETISFKEAKKLANSEKLEEDLIFAGLNPFENLNTSIFNVYNKKEKEKKDSTESLTKLIAEQSAFIDTQKELANKLKKELEEKENLTIDERNTEIRRAQRDNKNLYSVIKEEGILLSSINLSTEEGLNAAYPVVVKLNNLTQIKKSLSNVNFKNCYLFGISSKENSEQLGILFDQITCETDLGLIYNANITASSELINGKEISYSEKNEQLAISNEIIDNLYTNYKNSFDLNTNIGAYVLNLEKDNNIKISLDTMSMEFMFSSDNKEFMSIANNPCPKNARLQTNGTCLFEKEYACSEGYEFNDVNNMCEKNIVETEETNIIKAKDSSSATSNNNFSNGVHNPFQEITEVFSGYIFNLLPIVMLAMGLILFLQTQRPTVLIASTISAGMIFFAKTMLMSVFIG